jgi:4-amino-4-deoxy-L-arabinose transferase-like glycosyltransferase
VPTHRASRWPLGALIVLIAICSLQHIYVTQRDTVPPAADGSGYYRSCLEWRDQARTGRWRALWRSMVRSDRRPPLVQVWTTALFLAVDEPSIQLARMGQLPFLWLLLIGTFAIGARLKDRETALLAASLVAGYPQVIGFSRLYWMDVPLAAMVVLSLWVLLATDRFERRGPSILFGLLMALGVLTKYSYPIFIIGPLVYVVRQSRRRWPHIVLAGGVAFVISAVWYVPMLSAAGLNYLYNQGVGPLHARSWWTLKNLFNYMSYLPRTQLGIPLFLLFILSLPFFIRYVESKVRWILFSWVCVPYLFFSYAVLGIEWSRFTLPYLPALALITALGLMRLRLPLVRAIAAAAGITALAQLLMLSHAPSTPTLYGDFIWERITGPGLLSPQSSDLYLEMEPLFGPHAQRRVALFPDHGVIASVLNTWAFEQQSGLSFSVPYVPEETNWQTTATLEPYTFVIRVISPVVRSIRFTPELRRFEQLWRREQHHFSPTAERRLPNGYRLLFYRRLSAPAA